MSGHTAWLRIDTPEAGYADTVVANLVRIAKASSGRAILERIRASGCRIMIERPAPTDPPNAGVGRQASGAQSDFLIGYDPKDWPSPFDPASRSSDEVLFTLLREALAQI